jgi:hypothetical protein
MRQPRLGGISTELLGSCALGRRLEQAWSEKLSHRQLLEIEAELESIARAVLEPLRQARRSVEPAAEAVPGPVDALSVSEHRLLRGKEA